MLCMNAEVDSNQRITNHLCLINHNGVSLEMLSWCEGSFVDDIACQVINGVVNAAGLSVNTAQSSTCKNVSAVFLIER